MYCPRCGEQQSTGNLRFCNRCGLPMGLVSELVANGGMLPQLQELTTKKKWFTRANGLKLSLVWFMFWFIITMLVAIGDGGDGVAVVFIIGLFGSIFMAVLSALFLKGQPKNIPQQEFIQNQNAMPQNLSGQKYSQNALPPQQMQSAQDYVSPGTGAWKAPDTGDLVSPGSVTEGTTKLLTKDELE